MASVVGESDAWRKIVTNLRRGGLVVHRPDEIKPLLSNLRETYSETVVRKKLEFAHRVASKQSRIAELHAEGSVWRSIANWFRIRGYKKAIAQLYLEEGRCFAALTMNISRLESLLGSGELAGARAELDVIAHLARLPANFIVFNDIRLTADRFIRFNGIPLQSAQLDHVVLSPAGVFVIETKCWGSRFVESGAYHDPFDQVQRASYLCYDQLRTQFGKVRVRSVIACVGKLPATPKDSRVKVLPISEIASYISWFRDKEFTADRLLQVRRYLERYARQ